MHCVSSVTCTACTWCDDDAVGFPDYVNGLVHVDLSVSTNDLHGLAPRCGRGAISTQDHIGQGAVHGLKEGQTIMQTHYCDSGHCASVHVTMDVYSPHT